MPRFLKVKGLPHIAVPRPDAAGRWAGKAPKPIGPDEKPDPDKSVLDLLSDVEEVLADDVALRKAARAGEILILDEGVGKSADAVTWKTKPVAAAPAVKKGG